MAHRFLRDNLPGKFLPTFVWRLSAELFQLNEKCWREVWNARSVAEVYNRQNVIVNQSITYYQPFRRNCQLILDSCTRIMQLSIRKQWHEESRHQFLQIPAPWLLLLYITKQSKDKLNCVRSYFWSYFNNILNSQLEPNYLWKS